MAAQVSDPAGLIWVENLLGPVINVAAFGGSITFSVVVADNQGAKYMPHLFPIFSALAWLFFIITLGLATAAQLALSFHKDEIREAFSKAEGKELAREANPDQENYNKRTRFVIGLFVVGKLGDVLCLTMMLAILFLSLSVVSYQLAIGIIATIFTVAMILLFVFSVVAQSLNRQKRD